MDYNEILCQAIDTIVAKRISEISFDKTILCTIVDNSKKDNGEYTVTDGSVTFQAYSDYTHYSQNMRVYVQVPMGDYANTKLIIGRYSTEDDEKPLAYVSPLEKVIQVGADYAADIQTPIGLIANGEKQTQALIANKPITESTISYDTFCIKADFKCLLQNYNIKSGNYGLRVLLTTEENEVVDIDLDCTKDMFGNPYAYTTYYPQSQTYRLNLTSNINSINAYFYQKDNFTYDDGINVELKRVPTQDYDNIFINNIEMYFAYDANEFSDNTVKINTADELEYNSLKDTALEKTLTLTWYNKDDNNKYLGFTDGEFGTLENAKNPELNTYHIVWEHSLNNGEWEVVGTNSKEINVHLVPIWSINEYRAKVIFQGNTYTSNILQFRGGTGISETQNRLNLLLNLKNGQYSLDSYPLYGADTSLINPSEGYRERELYFTYESTVGGSFEPIILDGATACFYIPNNATMLTRPYEESSSEEKYQLEGYSVYVRQLSSELAEEDRVFKYRIKNNYNPLFSNNTMILKIIDKYGYEYTAQKSVSFSSYGTSGTDYTIIISDKKGQGAFVNYNPLQLQAQLYDANFKEIETDDWVWTLYPSNATFNQNTAGNQDSDSDKRDAAYLKYVVAQAATKVTWLDEDDITIKGLYPISYSYSLDYMYQGPTTIIYDSSGIKPIYYDGDICLFNKTTGESIDCKWDIQYYQITKESQKNPNALTDIEKAANKGIATLTQVKDSIYPRLKVSSIFLSSNDIYLVLQAKNNSGTILWRQPLIILQNQYASALLNNWDGNLVVDNSGNYILSSMMGAGSKNSDNQFSGVLMGEVGKVADKSAETGLFGYHQGAQSFGFNVNGTAFLGKSGHGRIEFNGNDGIIKSADDTGMSINLSTGNITTTNFNLNANNNNFILSSNSSPYVKIYQNKNNYLEYSDAGLSIRVPEANLIIGEETVGAKIEASENKITSLVESVGAQIQFYGICETAAATNLKSVVILNTKNFPTMSADKYPTGTTISVRFVNGNTSDTMKLSMSHVAVDSGGEDVFIANSSKGMPQLATGDSVIFIYDAEINGGNGAWVITDGGAKSQITQTASVITLRVEETEKNISALSINTQGITGEAINRTGTGFQFNLDNNSFRVGPINGDPVLKIDSAGLILNGSGTFTGTITADYLKANTGGEIAGFTIAPGSLSYNNKSLYLGTTAISAVIGNITRNNLVLKVGNNFGVTNGGIAYLNNGYISNNLYVNGVLNFSQFTLTNNISSGTLGKVQRQYLIGIDVQSIQVSSSYTENFGAHLSIDVRFKDSSLAYPWNQEDIVHCIVSDDGGNTVEFSFNPVREKDQGNLNSQEGLGGFTMDFYIDDITRTNGSLVSKPIRWTIRVNLFNTITEAMIQIGNAFIPSISNTYSLGTQDSKWKALYVGTIYETSDRAKKQEYVKFNNQFSFYDKLIPKIYTFTDDTENKIHFGFYAQDVEQVIQQEFPDKALGIISKNTNNLNYSLHYSEFIALNTWQIQMLKQRINQLETYIGIKGEI